MKLWTNAELDGLRNGLSMADKTKRHGVRYACFRVQNELNGGAKADKEHYKIAKKVEKLDGFGGWKSFAVTWDVSTPNPIVLIRRKWSIYEEWDQTLERITVPLKPLKKKLKKQVSPYKRD